MAYEIAGRQIVILAILVLYLGYFVNARWQFLSNNSIPVAVSGGFLFSIFAAILASLSVVELTFDLELRNLLLLIFFSTIGLNARLSSLVKGGKALVILVFACAVFLVLQNTLGVAVATAFGREPILGLFGGSISLVGGHGTAIAWGEVVQGRGIEGAAEFGIAIATFGLVLGGLMAGPVAGWIIKTRKLKPNPQDANGAATADTLPLAADAEPKKHLVSVENIIETILALALCLAIGDGVNRYLFEFEIRLPGFLTALLAGIIITNISDALKLRLNSDGIDLSGGVALQLYLVMSLMSMDLLSLVGSASLLIVTVFFQALLIVFFATLVVFRLLGRDYDAAVMVGGFVGLGLGATPVAIAGMDAVSKKYGKSMKAFLVVPLVGAFFIDLINAAVIELFLKQPFMN